VVGRAAAVLGTRRAAGLGALLVALCAWDALANELPAGGMLQTVARASRARAERERVQEAALVRLAEHIQAPTVQLPLMLVDDFRRREIDALGEVLRAGFDAR